MFWNQNISVYRGVRELHFTMRGEFNDAFAYELLHCFQNNYAGQPKVFFHTSGLQQIQPGSAEKFVQHLNRLYVDRNGFTFTGGNAASLGAES